MKAAFLDTSYVLALELSNDQNHRAALKHWRSTIKSLPSLVTTSYIFDEITTYFNNHGYHSKAIEVGDRLLSSSSVQLVHVDEDLFNQAWQYFQDHQDKRYSFTDCVSFVVMKNLEIETAFAFDKHFVQARFKRVP
jgi:predicted nucleic acid-binding protein